MGEKKKRNKKWQPAETGSERQPNKNTQDEILKIFANSPFSSFNYKQISKRLKINNTSGRKFIMELLDNMTDDRILKKLNEGKYQLVQRNLAGLHSQSPADSENYKIGTVDMKRTGKAYVIPDDKTEDIQIAPNNTDRALNRDKVKVFIFPRRKEKRLEGQIVEIISRSKTSFVGIVQISRNFAFLLPDNPSIQVDIFIPLTELNGAKEGEKAIAEITDWPESSKNPFGRITHVLGKPGDNNVEMQSILAEYDFPLSFPKAVEDEAHSIKDKISATEIKNRRDFRDIFTFTCDPVDAKDFDDALSLRKLENGNYEIGIHIADVSHYVKEQTILDQETYKRGTSVYLVDRVIPMLPEKLSNGVCSLRPNEDKLCFSAVFEMNENAEVLDEWFGKTIINSNRRFNYDEVQEIIENGELRIENENRQKSKVKSQKKKGESDECYTEQIHLLHNIAKKLREERFKKGSINFFTEEVKFKLDEHGNPLEVYIKEQKDSHKLVEDFMLLANRKVAELIGKKKEGKTEKTFVYRIHDRPSEEKLEDFKNFVNNLGYKIRIDTPKAIAESFNKMLQEVIGKAEENIVTQLAIRTMAKAFYSTKNIGHYGLAFPYYTHFTSPIRRYPDLMVHRLLEKYYLDQEKSVNQDDYEKKCRHCSDMERKAVEAERASVKYKQIEFMKDKVGDEFDGVISGISKWGLYIELDENKCEGMVRIRDITDDMYYLDEDNYRFVGQRTGKIYKLGDNVRIEVKNADLQRKHLDFVFVD